MRNQDEKLQREGEAINHQLETQENRNREFREKHEKRVKESLDDIIRRMNQRGENSPNK